MQERSLKYEIKGEKTMFLMNSLISKILFRFVTFMEYIKEKLQRKNVNKKLNSNILQIYK